MRIKGVSICEPDCPDRNAECHGKCEKYLEYHKARKEANEARCKEKEIYRYNDDSVRRTERGYYNRLIRRYRPK